MQPNEPTQPGAPTGDDPGTGGQNPTGGTPPTTPPAPTGDGPDLSKLTPDQLSKVLENPELWNLPRIKELREQAAEAKKLKDAQDQAADAALVEQKKFEDLANKRGEENAALKTELQEMRINQTLTSKLSPLGVLDLDGALKLIDRSAIKVDDNGNVTGVDEAVEALKTGKAYLFNGTPGTNPTVGAPSNPTNQSGTGGVQKFKRSQLKDTKFYNENRAEILKAMAAGEIEDDISR